MAIGTAAAILGGSLASGILGSRSSDRAADAQADASSAAIAEQRRQFDLTRSDLQPFISAGNQALNDILFEFGYQPFTGAATPAPATPQVDPNQTVSIRGVRVPLNWLMGQQPQAAPEAPAVPSPVAPNIGFRASPDFEFRRSEGLRDINNSFAARGGALSGNALRALTEFNSNLASQEFGNWFERRSRLAGLGSSATNTGAQVGSQTAGNIGNALIGAGNARASGITGSANAINDAIQGGIANWLLMRNTRNV